MALRVDKYSPNTVGKDFVCSDIHGCFQQLEEQLERVAFNKEKDRLFCVGDLVDRGPESHKALKYLDEPWFFSILGNHEDLIVTCQFQLHEQNGGLWFNELSIDEKDEFHLKFRELPIAIQVGNVGIVHADMPTSDWNYFLEVLDKPGTFGKEQRRFYEMAIWGRVTILSVEHKQVKNIDKVYLGHTILKSPKRLGNMHFIDTGSFLREKDHTVLGIHVEEIKHR